MIIIFCKETLYQGKCGALRDFIPFVQFKKREKHPWRIVTKSCNAPQIGRKNLFWIDFFSINISKNRFKEEVLFVFKGQIVIIVAIKLLLM